MNEIGVERGGGLTSVLRVPGQEVGREDVRLIARVDADDGLVLVAAVRGSGDKVARHLQALAALLGVGLRPDPDEELSVRVEQEDVLVVEVLLHEALHLGQSEGTRGV